MYYMVLLHFDIWIVLKKKPINILVTNRDTQR